MVRNSGGDKTNLNEVGLNSIENETVKNNLMGKSRFMNKKGWVDAQGRKVRRQAGRWMPRGARFGACSAW